MTYLFIIIYHLSPALSNIAWARHKQRLAHEPQNSALVLKSVGKGTAKKRKRLYYITLRNIVTFWRKMLLINRL